MADSAFHTPLVHEGILAVRGPDAAKFLQGQLTCNLAYLNDETSSLGGRCTIKGRLLSSFRILLQGDGLLLALASELLEAQLADLKKYAVFSK
ncbi:folate-binding protein, partial [Pseudomonas aeruginosa]|nr:folate-binding protein [Pseudomonas aeruginosa]